MLDSIKSFLVNKYDKKDLREAKMNIGWQIT